MFTGKLSGTALQFMASLVACVVIIPGGMHYGWTAPTFPKLYNSSIEITKDDEIWLESTFFAAQIVSLPGTVYMMDSIGRRASILVAAAIGVVPWVILGLTYKVLFLYIARFLAGVSYSISFTAAPIYISEIANQKYRGLLTVFVFMATVIGTILIYSLVPYLPYYVPSLVGGLFLLLHLIIFCFMPESPHYLMSVGKTHLAGQALRRLRSGENPEHEIKEITKTIEIENNGNNKFKELLFVKNNRRNLMLLVFLAFAQQFSGFSVILMNMEEILYETQSSQYFRLDLIQIIFSVFMLVGSIICAISVDKIGRKCLLVLSCASAGILLLGLAVYCQIFLSGFDTEAFRWLAPVSLILFAICYHLGLGPLIETLEAELFTTKVRALGTTVSGAFNCIFGFVSLPLYHYLHDSFSLCVPFYIFAVTGLLSAVVCFKFLTETKGKSLEEIQRVLNEQELVQ